MTAHSPLLDVSAVVKDYRGLRPLRMARLTLAPGEQVALVGLDAPAAEMLTTLLTGAATPDAGTIHVLGTPTAGITDADQWIRLVDRIGLVTERAALLDMLSAVQNLALSFSLAIDPPPDDVRRRAVALATEVGLPEASWERPVGEADGSQRIRIRLGRALAFEPALLLLEHPTATVDRALVPTLAADVRAIVSRRGLATLALTADEAFAEACGLRIVHWDAATGALREPRRRWFFRGR